MEILDLIAKISWDTNTKELQAVGAEMKKQDQLLDELRVKGGRLERQMLETNDPKKVKQYNDELQRTRKAADSIVEAQKKQVQVSKNLVDEQKKLQAELRKTNDPNAVKGLLQGLHKVENQITAVTAKTQTMGNKLGGVGSSIMQGIGLGAGIFAVESIVSGITNFASSSIQAVSDINETISKTGVVFGETSQEILDWSKTTADSFGMSQQQALDAASTFAIFGKSAGLVGGELNDFSIKMSAMAADLASFHNTSPQEAIEAIGAALRGEAEPLRRYGILLDDATLRQTAMKQGLIRTTKEALTPQTKVLAAYTEILKQSSDAQGDFERTSDSVSNQQKILQARIDNLKTEIGTGLIPVYAELLESINDVIKGSARLFEGEAKRNATINKNTLQEGKTRLEAMSKQDLKYEMSLQATRMQNIKDSEQRALKVQEEIKAKGRDGLSRKDFEEKQKQLKNEKDYQDKYRAEIYGVNLAWNSFDEREAKKAEAKRKADLAKQGQDKGLTDEEKKAIKERNKAIEERKKALEKINQDYLTAKKTFEDEKEKSTLSAQDYELFKLNEHFDDIISAYKKAGKSILDVEELRFKLANEIRYKYEQEQINAVLKKQEETKKKAKTLDPITGEFLPGSSGDISTITPSAFETKERLEKDAQDEDSRKKKKEQDKQDVADAKMQIFDETMALADAAQQAIDIEKQKNDELIRLQEERVQATKGLSDKSLKIEEDRLQELLEKREKYERAQRVIDAAQIVANQALAVSNAIVAITKAARDGGPAAPFLIAANVIAIAAGVFAATNAVRSIDAGFKDGGYTGEGDPNDVSTKLGNRGYKYHKKEFVMDEELTSKHRNLFEGLHKRDMVVKQLDDGNFYITRNGLDPDAIVNDHNTINESMMGTALLYEMQSIRELLKQRELSVNNNFDAQGFGQAVGGQLRNITLKNLRRTW
jgi:hypothetical protein